MNQFYDDILSRITEPPKWWDEQAVPRFDDFSPDQVNNAYADEVVFFLIGCQQCRREFKVTVSANSLDVGEREHLLTQIRNGSLHYGDPPNVNCCSAGPTMNSVPLRVLEYWRRSKAPSDHWTRLSDLETLALPDWTLDWAKENTE